MQPVTPHIYFIGAEDDNLDLFEGLYPVPNGISYNSYIIDAKHPAIIDAVDIRRCDDWLTSVEIAVNRIGRKPEYLIVQHVEPDHSGSIRAIMERYPDMKIVATVKAIQMLGNFFEDIDFGQHTISVADGGTLDLGGATLNFITAPMVHWPEVMLTLEQNEGVLFSADAFGSFAMSSSTDAWDSEARRYYANIVGRFGTSVQALMKKLKGRQFSVIAPLHGPVLKNNLSHYWSLYDKWSRYEPESDGVLVAYASIYGGTAEAARRIAAMLESEGANDVTLIDLGRHNVSYAVAEAFRFKRMVLCSATYDADLFPPMHEFLHHIERKNLKNRTVGLVENGSWAPIAAKLMTDVISRMKDMTIVSPTVTLTSRIHRDNIPALEALAKAMLV